MSFALKLNCFYRRHTGGDDEPMSADLAFIRISEISMGLTARNDTGTSGFPIHMSGFVVVYLLEIVAILRTVTWASE